MDSRRLFLSKKDDTSRYEPYSKPQRVISLVKRIFSWGSNPNNSQVQDETYAKVKPFKYPPPSSSTTPLSKRQPSEQQTPSQVLSSFFLEKGDKPLTDIEYEGVQALLAKSRANDTTVGDVSVLEGKNKRRRSLMQAPSAANRSLLANLTGNGSFFYSTPQKQTLLHNPNASQIITPDYRPTYHSVNPRTLQSVKRVYHFSGVPSPYRTRITAPTRSNRAKQVLQSDKLQNPAPSLPSTSEATEPKPLSSTAGAILSIIDGTENNGTTLSKPEFKTGKFSNPYSSAGSIKAKKSDSSRSASLKPRSTLVNAKDIEMTTSFAKSEPIEALEPSVQAVQGPKFKADTPSSAKSNGDASDTKKNETPSTFTTAPPTVSDYSSTPKNPFSFFKPTPAAHSTAQPTTEAQRPTPEAPKINSQQPPKPKHEFSFPQIEFKVVELDSAKVQSFKSGFTF